MDTAKAVSEAIKGMNRWRRPDAGRAFARKMRAHADRIRDWGCKLPGGKNAAIPRDIMNALCMGCGDDHNRRMIKKYEAAAKAAERFWHRR